MNKVLINKLTLVQHSPLSPFRIILLRDDTHTHPTGRAWFVGHKGNSLPDCMYDIHSVWCAGDTGDIFLGIKHEDRLYHYGISEFLSGRLNEKSDELDDFWLRGGVVTKPQGDSI